MGGGEWRVERTARSDDATVRHDANVSTYVRLRTPDSFGICEFSQPKQFRQDAGSKCIHHNNQHGGAATTLHQNRCSSLTKWNPYSSEGRKYAAKPSEFYSNFNASDSIFQEGEIDSTSTASTQIVYQAQNNKIYELSKEVRYDLLPQGLQIDIL